MNAATALGMFSMMTGAVLLASASVPSETVEAEAAAVVPALAAVVQEGIAGELDWPGAARQVAAEAGASAGGKTGELDEAGASAGGKTGEVDEAGASAGGKTGEGAEAGEPGHRRLIVIDPGHGGTNSGAPGATPGFYEKRLTLRLARDLASRLRQRGYRVVLTRERDQYLTLRQRMVQANRLGADLFISVHGNATETHAQRGYETYILTPRALDIDSRALRTADGPSRAGVDAQVALLLDDLERGAAHPRAADLAAAIQDELRVVRGKDGDRGVRQDAQHVLLGATMPAVLVEVGFVDHAIEGRELLEPAVQEQIATALATAIERALPVSTESPARQD